MAPWREIGGDVITSCKAGDQGAFREIVVCYQKKVFNLAYRMLGNREEAREVSQEVFLSVFGAIRELREEVKFGAWLTRITLNHCRNKWKYLKRRHYFSSDSLDDPVQTEEGEIPREIADPSDNPERLYEKKTVQIFVHEGLGKLPLEQREMVVLRDLQGYSYEEIAELLHLPVGTVKSRLHRARMDLKEVLQKLSQ
jgi:RNA polymerase sigma-70 factor, ECF subfamily